MRRWIILSLLLVAVVASGCTGQNQHTGSFPSDKTTVGEADGVPEPARQTILQFFAALSKQDFQTAYQLLSESNRKGMQPSDLASNRIKKATVRQIKLLAVAEGPANSARFEVTVDVEVSGVSPWQQGKNVRQFLMTEYNGVWKIDSITSGP